MNLIWFVYSYSNNWTVEVLVLARKINESIMIGDNIEVVVVDIKGDQIKLGIRAPKEVSVHRAEIYSEIQEQNKKAVITNPGAVKNLNHLLNKKKK